MYVNYVVGDRWSEALLRGSADGHVGLRIVAEEGGVVLLVASGALQTVAHGSSLSLFLSLAASCQLCGSLARRIRASTPIARSRFPVPRERLQDAQRRRRRQRGSDVRRTHDRAPCHFTWTVAPRGATTSAVDSSRDAARATLGQRDRDRTMQ